MDFKKCIECGKMYQKCFKVHRQRYCSAPECQRKRRQYWQQNKRKSDPDYKDNQSRAQRNWIKKNPDYWRKYRNTHPKYKARNQELQRNRNRKRKKNMIAKRGRDG